MVKHASQYEDELFAAIGPHVIIALIAVLVGITVLFVLANPSRIEHSFAEVQANGWHPPG